nr:unnamed protein product [Digitaria exilis]
MGTSTTRDFERSGILDDGINETIVRLLGRGVKLHIIIDTCHSSTILDLPYLCRMYRTGTDDWPSAPALPRKPSSFASDSEVAKQQHKA